MFVLYLLVRVFVLYLLRGCMIPYTLMWSLYASWFQGPNIHLLLFLVSLSWNILFDSDEYHDQASKIIKETFLRRLGHEISYHVICAAPLYIQFLLIDMVSDEK